MAIVTVFPQKNNLQFFVNFPKNVYHRENSKCICFKKKANKATVIQLKKKLNPCLIDKTIFR